MSGMPAAAPAATSVEPIAGADADAAASDPAASDPAAADGRRRAAGVPERPASTASPSCSARRTATSDRTRGSSRARSPSRASRCSRTTRTSARRCRRSGRRWGCTAPSCATTAGSTSAATRFSGLPGRDHRPQRAHRLGAHEPRPRRRRPLPRAPRRRHLRTRRRRRPAHAPRGDHRGGRRRPGHDHGALHRPRPARHRHRRRLRRRRGGLPRGIRPARGRLRRLAAVDGADAGHHPAGGLRDEPRAGLERLPRGRLALRRAGAEPHLRRRRRQHRLPGARAPSPCAPPATAPFRSPAGPARTAGAARCRSTSSRRCSTPSAGTSSRPTTP